MIRSVPTAATTCCHCLAGTGMLLLALTAPLAVAQEKNSGGIYSCVDSKGRRLTSDRPIVDCLDREQKELGASGTVRRVVPPSYTAEERARLEEQRRAEELERSRIAEERRRERALLIRYPNQAMHDKERAEALKQIDEVIEAVKKRVTEALAGSARRSTKSWSSTRATPTRRRPGCKRKLEDNAQQVQIQNRFLSDQNAGKAAHQRPVRRRAGQAQACSGRLRPPCKPLRRSVFPRGTNGPQSRRRFHGVCGWGQRFGRALASHSA